MFGWAILRYCHTNIHLSYIMETSRNTSTYSRVVFDLQCEQLDRCCFCMSGIKRNHMRLMIYISRWYSSIHAFKWAIHLYLVLNIMKDGVMHVRQGSIQNWNQKTELCGSAADKLCCVMLQMFWLFWTTFTIRNFSKIPLKRGLSIWITHVSSAIGS